MVYITINDAAEDQENWKKKKGYKPLLFLTMVLLGLSMYSRYLYGSLRNAAETGAVMMLREGEASRNQADPVETEPLTDEDFELIEQQVDFDSMVAEANDARITASAQSSAQPGLVTTLSASQVNNIDANVFFITTLLFSSVYINFSNNRTRRCYRMGWKGAFNLDGIGLSSSFAECYTKEEKDENLLLESDHASIIGAGAIFSGGVLRLSKGGNSRTFECIGVGFGAAGLSKLDGKSKIKEIGCETISCNFDGKPYIVDKISSTIDITQKERLGYTTGASIAFIKDGNKIVSQYDRGNFFKWRTETRKLISVPGGSPRGVGVPADKEDRVVRLLKQYRD